MKNYCPEGADIVGNKNNRRNSENIDPEGSQNTKNNGFYFGGPAVRTLQAGNKGNHQKNKGLPADAVPGNPDSFS